MQQPKNNCAVKRVINGNISNIKAGVFKKDKNKVKFISTFSSLKNSNSDKRFKINTKLNITVKTKKSDLKKIRVMNLI